ncbi:MAG: recombinase family protein [Planctomycetota bacterium]|nr:recombinase family protein [Planctomycetota bacterium]
MAKAAMYLRVSMEQDDKNSFDAQRSKILEVARANGDEIVDSDQDDGESGKSGDRAGFLRLLRKIKNGELKVSKLYVFKFSRFMRNLDESSFFKMLLESYGVTVVSAMEPIPDDGPMGRFFQKVIALVDELSSDITGMHVLAGMEEIARKKYWTGGPPPFGYRLIEIPDRDNPVGKNGPVLRGDLIPHETQAQIVRRIFELSVSTGLGGGRIYAILCAEAGGPVLGSNGAPLGARGVNVILRKTIYKGLFIYNSHGMKLVYNEDGGSERRMRNSRYAKHEEKWVQVQNEAWRLISDELWEAAQRSRKANYRAEFGQGPAKANYLLTGLFVCGACGKSVGGHFQQNADGSNRYHYYRCRESVGGKVCLNRAKVRGIPLETALLAKVEADLFSENFFDDLIEEIIRLHAAEEAGKPDRSAYEKRLAELSAEILRLTELALQAPDVREIGSCIRRKEEERKDIEARLAAVPAPAKPLNCAALLETVRLKLGKTRDLLKSKSDMAEMRMELRKWIEAIRLDPDGRVWVKWNGAAIFEFLELQPASEPGEGEPPPPGSDITRRP